MLQRPEIGPWLAEVVDVDSDRHEFAIKADGNELLTNFRFFVREQRCPHGRSHDQARDSPTRNFNLHMAALLVAAAATSVGFTEHGSIAVFSTNLRFFGQAQRQAALRSAR